jgi:curved DNA-binding protein CbpA
MTRSLYSILNVSPDADPAVIEAAYKALMKKYHPDVLVGEPETTLRRAAEINQAFRVLRDPERRAEYDSQEQSRQGAMRMEMQSAEMRQKHFQHIQQPKRSKWPALLLIAVLAALVAYVWQNTDGTDREQFASAIPAEPAGMKDQMLQATGVSSAFPPVNPINIDRAIAEARRVNEKMGLMGLSGYSQDCFASQSRSTKLQELDFCVAFDSAASTYDTYSARIYSLPELPRFQPREMMSRHLGAAKTVSEDDDWVLDRLAQVRSLTTARLEALKPPVPVAAAVAAPKAAPAESPPQVIATQRQAPRQTARPPVRRRQQRPADADFLERQGYIY